MNDEKLTQNRSFFVAKDNRLITKSRYSLTLQQQKILLYLISRIKPNDEQGEIYELSIKDFAKVCGYVEDSGYYYQTIKADIKKLRDVSSWIEVEPNKEVLFSWIDRAEIDRKNGTLRISFHSTVSPYLFELREKYTQYSLYNVLCLSHKYSIRLYEYLCTMKFKEEFEITMDELRKHIDAEKYTKFSHFKDRVFDPAVDDINNYTDLNIQYAFGKTGKKITHIKFKFIEQDAKRYTFSHMMRENKIDPRQRQKEREYKKKSAARNMEPIEVEGTVTAQLTIDEFLDAIKGGGS